MQTLLSRQRSDNLHIHSKALLLQEQPPEIAHVMWRLWPRRCTFSGGRRVAHRKLLRHAAGVAGAARVVQAAAELAGHDLEVHRLATIRIPLCQVTTLCRSVAIECLNSCTALLSVHLHRLNRYVAIWLLLKLVHDRAIGLCMMQTVGQAEAPSS